MLGHQFHAHGGNPPIAPTGSDLVQGARLKVLNEQDARIALETLVARVQRGEPFRRNRRSCHRRQSKRLVREAHPAQGPCAAQGIRQDDDCPGSSRLPGALLRCPRVVCAGGRVFHGFSSFLVAHKGSQSRGGQRADHGRCCSDRYRAGTPRETEVCVEVSMPSQQSGNGRTSCSVVHFSFSNSVPPTSPVGDYFDLFGSVCFAAKINAARLARASS